MATAKWFDRYQSTLASGYTSGGTSLSVTSASGLTGTAGDFYVLVEADGSNTEEVFKVTAISGTTLTVVGAQANTTASNHGASAVIRGAVMTSGAITQVKLDIASSMTVAAFDTETTTGTANPAGRGLVYLSDGIYQCLWNGTTWEYYFRGQRAYRPAASAFTTINGASLTSYGGALRIQAAGNENMRGALVNVPAAPYTLRLSYMPLLESGWDVLVCGGVWATSTALVVAGMIGRSASADKRQLYSAKFNRPSTWVGDYLLVNADIYLPSGDMVYQEMSDNGTNRQLKYGYAPGLMQPVKHGVSRTDFLTATQIGFIAHSQHASAGAGIVLVSWDIV